MVLVCTIWLWVNKSPVRSGLSIKVLQMEVVCGSRCAKQQVRAMHSASFLALMEIVASLSRHEQVHMKRGHE